MSPIFPLRLTFTHALNATQEFVDALQQAVVTDPTALATSNPRLVALCNCVRAGCPQPAPSSHACKISFSGQQANCIRSVKSNSTHSASSFSITYAPCTCSINVLQCRSRCIDTELMSLVACSNIAEVIATFYHAHSRGPNK